MFLRHEIQMRVKAYQNTPYDDFSILLVIKEPERRTKKKRFDEKINPENVGTKTDTIQKTADKCAELYRRRQETVQTASGKCLDSG